MAATKHVATMNAESVKAFLKKLNTNTKFRNQFLDDPVGTLRDAHIAINLEDAKKLELAVSYLKDDIKHIFEMPSGSRDFLKQMGLGINFPPEIEIEVDEPGVKVV